LAVGVAFGTGVDPRVPRLGDASAYHLLAQNLAHGRGYIRPFDYQLLGRTRATAEYPALFAGLLAAATKVGAHSVESQRLFLSVVGAISVVLIGLVGRRVAGPTAGLVAAAVAWVYAMLLLGDATL